MTAGFWHEKRGEGPLVAVALHHGHQVREEVAQLLAVSEEERFREQDPHTGDWAAVAPSRVVAMRSRFEVDLNRPREQAVYRDAEDAWGLEVWKSPPPPELIERSLAQYDGFYDALYELLREIEQRHGHFVVLDLHTYNHRRSGPDGPEAEDVRNPQVNVGTGTLERSRWGSLADRFISDLRSYEFPGGYLDVRENVKFDGGQFSDWVHQNFPDSGCSLSVEIKKFFMDEWTGEVDHRLVDAIGEALGSTVEGILAELERVKTSLP